METIRSRPALLLANFGGQICALNASVIPLTGQIPGGVPVPSCRGEACESGDRSSTERRWVLKLENKEEMTHDAENFSGA